jgi:aminoglycoside 6-adenylyltransferase
MLNKIIKWAEKEDNIHAVILTGSRASKKPIDKFSDFDIAIFVNNQKKYITDDLWIHKIAKIWVYIPETINFNNYSIPTRLVIFKDGTNADISIYTLDILKKLISKKELPFACELGYKVLLDKYKITKNIPKAPEKRKINTKPTQQEFLSAINIFFFEAYHVAKYLVRNDLWHAKFRDWTTKEYLLKMIEWHEQSTHNFNYNTFWHGKNIKLWTRKSTLDNLNKIFGHFNKSDSAKSLIYTINLFRQISKQTAKNLNYKYPINIDKNITSFIKKLLIYKK